MASPFIWPTGGLALDFNPNHEPGGSDKGGEFASGDGGGKGPTEDDLHDAVLQYTNWDSSEINMVLQHGAAGHLPVWVRRQRAKIKLLDHAFATASPLKSPMVVWRAVEHYKELRNGRVFVEKRFVSTTKSEAVAQKAVRGSGEGAVYQITIPKGARVIDINHRFSSVQPREREVLLPRGTRFKVVYGPLGHLRMLLK